MLSTPRLNLKKGIHISHWKEERGSDDLIEATLPPTPGLFLASEITNFLLGVHNALPLVRGRGTYQLINRL